MSRATILAITLLLSLTTQLHAQNPSSVELTKTLSGHTKSIQEIAFSPRGELLAASSNDGTVRLWNVASGEPLGTIPGQKNVEPSKLSWSVDERRLAVTYRVKRSWELAICEVPATQPLTISHRIEILEFLEWSPDNRTFLAVDHQFKLKLWDAVSGQSTHTLAHEIPSDKVLIASFVANGQRVITGAIGETVKLWDTTSGKLLETYPPNTEIFGPDSHNIDVPLVSKDKRFFISGNKQVYEAESGSLLTSLKDEIPISFSPDGKRLLTVRHDDLSKSSRNYLAVRMIAGGEEVSTFQIPDDIANIFWSPNGEKIAIVGYEFDTRIFDTATGRESRHSYFGNCWPWQLCGSDGCEALRFSVDAALLLKEKTPIKLWDTKNVSLIKELKSARLPASFSPTGRILATRSNDKKSVLLWSF